MPKSFYKIPFNFRIILEKVQNGSFDYFFYGWAVSKTVYIKYILFSVTKAVLTTRCINYSGIKVVLTTGREKCFSIYI